MVVRPDLEGPGWHDHVDSRLRGAGLWLHRFSSSRGAIERVELGGLAGAVLFAGAGDAEGLTLLRIIRSIDQRLPCWVVTPASSRRVWQAAFDLRVTGVMTRPVEPAEFSFTLTRALGGVGSPEAGSCSAALEFTHERSDINDG